MPRAPFTGRTKITKTKPSPHLSADAAWPACTGHVAAGAQSDLIWVHRLVIAEVPPTVQKAVLVPALALRCRRAVIVLARAG